MPATNKPYIPINCAFHDYLEHFATLRQLVTIVYIDEKSLKKVVINQAMIVDLTGGRNGEFSHVKFPGGNKIIRNDYLISVGDVKASDFDQDKCGI